MKKQIFLHGHLKELYPHPIEVEASSVAEAIRYLELIPELHTQDGSPHPVTIAGVDNDVELFGTTTMNEIHVHPRMGGGGGKGGLFQVLLGIALIGLAIWTGGATLTVFGVGFSSSTLMLTGAMLAIGGILQMLMPVPDTKDKDEGSKYLSANGNTVKIGTKIPILFGTRRIFGHYLSFDVDAAALSTGISNGPWVPAAGSVSDGYKARNAIAPYDAGKFSYTGYTAATPELIQAAGSQFPPDANWTVYARGFISTINATSLWSTLTDGARDRGFVLQYKCRIKPTVNGVHVVQSTGPEGTQIRILDSSSNDVTASPLVANQIYTVEVFYARTNYLVASPIYSARIQAPGGSLVDLETSPLVQAIPPAPAPAILANSIFVEYDKTTLSTGIRPIRPIYQSNIAGPSNIPTSDWSA